MTRADFLGGLALTMIVPTLKSDRAGEPAGPQDDTPSEVIDLSDYVHRHATDATDGFVAFVRALNASRSARVVGIVPPGTYRLDSVRLAQADFVIGRDDVTLRGEGKPVLAIGGTVALPALIRFRNCSGRVEGLSLVGNGQGSGYTNGSAIQFLVDPDAVKPVAFMEVTGCDFDNFRSPSWVYGYVSNATMGIDRVLIQGNAVTSRPNNSISPGALGMQAAAFKLQSKTKTRRGGGGIRNVVIADNRIDARYIKSGVFLSDRVERCAIRNNRVIAAGVDGARDDAGGYAFAAYDSDKLGMRDVAFIKNIVEGVRSVGIYCAGPDNVTIEYLEGSGQIDAADATLPKGMVVLNGVSRFRVGHITTRNVADTGIYVVAARSGTTGSIHDVDAARSRNAIYLVSAFGPSTITVERLRARDCLYGILGNLVDGGRAESWTLRDLDIASGRPRSMGVRVFAEGITPIAPALRIGGNSVIETSLGGIIVPRIRAGMIAIDGVTFRGSFAGAAIDADGAHGLVLDNLVFENQDSNGYSLRLAGARGRLGQGITFRGGAPDHRMTGAAGLRLGAPIT